MSSRLGAPQLALPVNSPPGDSSPCGSQSGNTAQNGPTPAQRTAVFSFFTGAGLLDLGFEAEGYDVCYVNEKHEPFLRAYKHSRTVLAHPEPVYGHDQRSIRTIDHGVLAARVREQRGSGAVVGFIGGPPCPDFSVGGKNAGVQGVNGPLSGVYVDLICSQRPDYFLFENVKGLWRTKKHRQYFDHMAYRLNRAGYRIHTRLINALEYGVPQDRERIIVLGFLDEALPERFSWLGQRYPDRTAFDYDWPDRDRFDERRAREPGADTPAELTVQHWFDRNRVDSHPNAAHCFQPRAALKRFQSVEEGDDSRKSYKRLHRWRYSPTAAYGNNEVHLHPYRARRLTVAEALAVQSMPRLFELPADMTLTDMFKAVGNGVPYLASKSIARSILRHLEESKCG